MLKTSSFDIEEGKHRQQQDLGKNRNVVAVGKFYYSSDSWFYLGSGRLCQSI